MKFNKTLNIYRPARRLFTEAIKQPQNQICKGRYLSHLRNISIFGLSFVGVGVLSYLSVKSIYKNYYVQGLIYSSGLLAFGALLKFRINVLSKCIKEIHVLENKDVKFSLLTGRTIISNVKDIRLQLYGGKQLEYQSLDFNNDYYPIVIKNDIFLVHKDMLIENKNLYYKIVEDLNDKEIDE